jgi:hypothetical protein
MLNQQTHQNFLLVGGHTTTYGLKVLKYTVQEKVQAKEKDLSNFVITSVITVKNQSYKHGALI